LEDLYDPDVYADAVREAFNVDCTMSVGKAKNLKWSDRMRLRFQASGQAWDDAVETTLKRTVSASITGAPGQALSEDADAIAAALAEVLEKKLAAARA
jgi:hypothetical protein